MTLSTGPNIGPLSNEADTAAQAAFLFDAIAKAAWPRRAGEIPHHGHQGVDFWVEVPGGRMHIQAGATEQVIRLEDESGSRELRLHRANDGQTVWPVFLPEDLAGFDRATREAVGLTSEQAA
ncbi:hypothetical protein HY346_01265 [Candidatus Microgenomates bacterium]|nr:hypothetical protein [Candidatus Microgenomates bacterium]